MGDLEKEFEKSSKETNHNLTFDFKPSDCKHCYVATRGVFGNHYACDKEKHCPLIICPNDCKYYEKGNN